MLNATEYRAAVNAWLVKLGMSTLSAQDAEFYRTHARYSVRDAVRVAIDVG